MKIKIILICSFCLFYSLLIATTWHIKQDGTGNFITIQEGINASVDSDTVLVYPGTYYENIIYYGKNIMVASLELTTGDPTYIASTVIDGQQQASCVRVMNFETTAQIQGFTITNGWGSQWYQSDGGGVHVRGAYQQPTSFSIKNCQITKNNSEAGGGIYAYRCILALSGVSIHNNFAHISAGGIMMDDANFTFDDINRCNIYDNIAGTGLDLYSIYCETNEVIVDTFSILDPTRYFANEFEMSLYPNPYTFDILNSSLQQVNSDLYVAPDGDDTNSGLSPNEPMKTIVQAIRKIESDSLNPKTIHLAPGVYSKSANEQYLAFGGKSNIKIIGAGKTTTIIDGENGFHPLFVMGGADNFVLKNMTFQNIIYNSRMLLVFNSNNTVFENLVIQNFTGSDVLPAFTSSPTESMYFKNVDFINCFTPEGVAAAYICEINHLEMDDCRFINNTCSGTTSIQLCAGLQTNTYNDGDIIIKNTVFSGNIIDACEYGVSALVLNTLNGESGKYTISNCLFENNQCLGTADRTVHIDGSDNIEINNTTFIDNTSTYTLTILRNPIEFHNNILRNNCNYEIFLPDNSPIGYMAELNISHCNIQGGQSAIYNQNNANIVNWGEGNIDEDPLFLLSGDDPYQLTEQSPCIDAGTPDTTGLFIPPWDLLYNERVVDGDGDGIAIIDIGAYEYQDSVSVQEDIITPITQTEISNYPNPFNPSTTIKLDLAESGKIELAIYNIKGQKVKTLLEAHSSKGHFEIIWRGVDDSKKKVASGQYFIKLKVNDKEKAMRKCVLLK